MVKWTHVLTGFGAKCESQGAYMECGGVGVGVEVEVGGRGWGWGLGVGPLSKYLRIVQKSRKNFCCLRTKWMAKLDFVRREREMASEREKTKCQQTILVNFTSANIIQMVINCNNNDRAEREREWDRRNEARGGTRRQTEAAGGWQRQQQRGTARTELKMGRRQP